MWDLLQVIFLVDTTAFISIYSTVIISCVCNMSTQLSSDIEMVSAVSSLLKISSNLLDLLYQDVASLGNLALFNVCVVGCSVLEMLSESEFKNSLQISMSNVGTIVKSSGEDGLTTGSLF